MSAPVPAPVPTPDPSRLSNVLRKEHAFIWRCVRRFGVLEPQVDDVVQEVFIIFSRRLSQIEMGKERAFLTSTAFNLASNWRRMSGRAPRLCELEAAEAKPTDQPSPEELLDQRRARQLLDRALDELPSKLRGPFVLREVEGLTRDEIAELLGLPPGTVATRVRLAAQKFEAIARRMTAAPTAPRGAP